MSSLTTPLTVATSRKMAFSVPIRNGSWSGIEMRWCGGVAVCKMIWLPTWLTLMKSKFHDLPS